VHVTEYNRRVFDSQPFNSATYTMAARRPPATRPRTSISGNFNITQQPRSRSVFSKSNSNRGLASSTDELPDSMALPASNSSSKQLKSGGQDAETNIQVVIRCRRRSEREIQENSPIIVSSQGPKSQEVTIETSTPISSLGIVTLPPTRTYPFDLVFGPEADQTAIYNDVVNPMLEEVLQGYNCTLFAYGQTGTGKTCVQIIRSIVPSGSHYSWLTDTLCKVTCHAHLWATHALRQE
jgi:kinesin family member 11